MSRGLCGLMLAALICAVPIRVLAAFDPAKPLPALTGKYIFDLLNVAESQEWYRESPDTSETVYSDWAGQSGRAWCSEFVSWCARQAQIPEEIIPSKNSALTFRTFFYQRNSYYLVEGGVPDTGCGCETRASGVLSLNDLRPGDILLVETDDDNTSLDHTALCRGVKDGKILTTEGNVNKTYIINGVSMKLGTVVLRTRNMSEIHGVCRPNYGNFCEEFGEHSWDAGVIVRKATCTEDELVKYTCTMCNATKTVENGKLPHTEVTDPAIAATCEVAGLTEGSHCKDCGVVIRRQYVTEPLGHSWGEAEVQVAATPLKEGWERLTCTRCGEIKTQSIKALGAPAAGTKISDRKTEAVYEVITPGLKGGTVAYAGPTDRKLPSVTIKSSVTLDGITYKVVAISAGAFKNNSYLKKIVIPSSVKQIGKQAFYKCKNLSRITVKSTSLTKKRVGSKAFQGISSRAVFRVPASRKKTYKTLFRARGAGSKITIASY